MTDTMTTNHNTTTSTRWELVIEQDQYSGPPQVYTFQLHEIEILLCGCCGASTENLVDDGGSWESVIGTAAAIESIRNGLTCGGDDSDFAHGGPIDLDRLTITGTAADGFKIADFRSTQ